MAKWLIFLAALCCLSGCVEQSPAPSIRVVTQVDVTATRNGENMQIRCQGPGSLSRILNYLRMLDPYTCVQINAETFRTDLYQITVICSDGRKKVYRQLHDEYLQVDNGPWKKIDPAIGSALSQILTDLEAGTPDTCNFSPSGI